MVDKTNLLKNGKKYYFNKVNMQIKIDGVFYNVKLGNMKIPIDLTGDVVLCTISENITYIWNIPTTLGGGSTIEVLDKVPEKGK